MRTPQLSISPSSRLPENRTGDVAHAANYLRYHAFQCRLEAHRGIDMVVVRPDEQAGQPAERDRRWRTRFGSHARFHPHLSRRVAVECGRAHRQPSLV